MINLTCNTCGSNSFKKEKNDYICQYCQSTIKTLPRYPKKKLQIIIILLLALLCMLFIGYKRLNNVQNDINYLTNMQIKKTPNKNTTISNAKIVYSLLPKHPSSQISSNRNKIKLLKIFLRNKTIVKVEQIVELGTFVSSPEKYEINYSYHNKPKYNYYKYNLYKNTPYDGLSQTYMYPSSSISELIAKINLDIKNKTCQRWPANTHGGNLYRDDNFWTNFCPKTELSIDLKNKLSI